MIRCLRCTHVFEARRPRSARLALAALALAFPTIFALGFLALSTAGFVIFLMPPALLAGAGLVGELARLAAPPVHCPECGADNAAAAPFESAAATLAAERTG